MAKDESGATSMSEESIGFLEDAKKGKPRKFAMICKGTEIVSLVVFKKGNVEKHKKEAKQSGKGQFYFGVLDGRGQDLRFVLARADGFDSAPVKPSVLKSFLDESAGLKCKPLFEIVDATPIVLDEDDPLVARFLKLRDVALQACDTHPDRAAEINTLCQQIGSHLDQGQTDPATEKLGDLEDLLRALAKPSAPSSNDDDARARKLAESLQKLKTAVDGVVKAQPERKEELYGSVTQIASQIKARQLDAAQASMLTLGKQLSRGVASPPPDSPASSNLQFEFSARCRDLEPRLLEAQQLDREKATALGNVWTYAQQQAEAGNYSNALKALDRLQQAIAGIVSAGPVAKTESGIAKKRTFLVTRFRELPAEIRPHVEALKKELQAREPQEDAEQLASAITAALEVLFDELREEIDSSITAGDSGLLKGLKDRVVKHELVEHLVTNPYTNGTPFQTVLFQALDEVEQVLAG